MADLSKIIKEANHIKNFSRRIIGSFIAASNITGILNDDLAITALLHSHGALSFWDYATAAPYVNINMNPKVASNLDRDHQHMKSAKKLYCIL